METKTVTQSPTSQLSVTNMRPEVIDMQHSQTRAIENLTRSDREDNRAIAIQNSTQERGTKAMLDLTQALITTMKSTTRRTQ